MKPYVICHMTTSIDGKVSGEFLYAKESDAAVETYYEIHRTLRENAQAIACGRITMEQSFTGCEKPDLTKFQNRIVSRKDFVAKTDTNFYAVAFDRKGSLNWKESKISDEDPGYDNAHIIEVLCENCEDAYLAYLRNRNISYIFAGKEEMDIVLALEKLNTLFSIETLLLEGGSILDGAFQKAGVIDALSLVVAPICAKGKDKPLFDQGGMEVYTLKKVKKYPGSVVWLNYTKGE